MAVREANEHFNVSVIWYLYRDKTYFSQLIYALQNHRLGKRQKSKYSSFFWASKTEILAQTLNVNHVKTTILIINLDFCKLDTLREISYWH